MSITKSKGSKDGRQKYRVRVDYYDNQGNRKQTEKTAYGLAEAKDIEMRLMAELQKATPSANMTVRELCEKYLEATKNEIRYSSWKKNNTTINHYVYPYISDIPLRKLNSATLQQWKQDVESGAELALKTKQNIYATLRAVINWGVKIDYMPNNPLTKVGNFRSSVTIKKEMDYYTAEEFQKFAEQALKHAQNTNTINAWDFYVFFCIAFYTGLRKGEIHALKWSDIDGIYLNVRRSITQKQKGEDIESAPKTKSSIRTLQMPKPLIAILKEHKMRWKQIDGFSKNYRICGGTRPLRDTSLQNYNKMISSAAGLKTIRIHDFRHSHASLLANAGINIQEVARRLGHANVEMTWNTYSHLYPKEEEKAVQILDSIKI